MDITAAGGWLKGRWALAIVAAALAAQWLLHVIDPAVPFPPYALGNWIIRETPGGFATEMIERLGPRARESLAAGTIVGALALGLLAGQRRGPALAFAGLGSLAAILLDPIAHTAARTALAVAAGLAAGMLAAVVVAPPAPPFDAGRRRIVAGGAGLAVLGIVTFTGIGRLRKDEPGTLQLASRYTLMADPAFDPPEGIPERITPTWRHYVIDINLSKPQIEAPNWNLRVHGAVREPLRVSFDEIVSLPAVEQPVLLQCISNTVGGDLVGNALWAGVPLSTILDRAGLDERALTIVARAADGYSDVIHRDELGDILIAWGMNGELLNATHGSPVRLLFPGRYGMRSVKWLTDIEAVLDQPDGYWAQRGWDRDAHMRTGARIDTPESHIDVPPTFATGGIAWGANGVSRVQVALDEDPWVDALLEERTGELGWYRWRTDVTATPGRHLLSVRAFDSEGVPQDPEPMAPHPAGAQGYDRVVIDVV